MVQCDVTVWTQFSGYGLVLSSARDNARNSFVVVSSLV